MWAEGAKDTTSQRHRRAEHQKKQLGRICTDRNRQRPQTQPQGTSKKKGEKESFVRQRVEEGVRVEGIWLPVATLTMSGGLRGYENKVRQKASFFGDETIQ